MICLCNKKKLVDKFIKSNYHNKESLTNLNKNIKIESLVDSIIKLDNKTYYFLKNEYIIKYKTDGLKSNIIDGYPKLISEELNQIPNNILTSYSINNNKELVFLTNDDIYVYSKGMGIKSGFPKKIKDNMPDFFNNATCAVNGVDGIIYIFKGDEYIVYIETKGILKGYPKKVIYNWGNWFINVDAGERITDTLYMFFKGNEFVLYDIKKGILPDYPKKVDEKEWPGLKFPKSNIKDSSNEDASNQETTTNISPDSNLVELKCPESYNRIGNSMACKAPNGNICSLSSEEQNLPQCSKSILPSLIVDGSIKYNEALLFIVFPQNWLGQDIHTIHWSNENVFVIEEYKDEKMYQSAEKDLLLETRESVMDKEVKSGDHIKLKNLITNNYYSYQSDDTFKIKNKSNKSIEDMSFITLHYGEDDKKTFQNANEKEIIIIRYSTVLTKFGSSQFDEDQVKQNEIITPADMDKEYEVDEVDEEDEEDIQKSINIEKSLLDDELIDEELLEKPSKLAAIDLTNKYCKVDGSDYTGNINKTINGFDCQSWDTQKPHKHQFNSIDHGHLGINKHNYCRNPNNEKQPWCYTTNKDIPIDYCDVGKKESTCEFKFDECDENCQRYCKKDGSDYRGTINITQSKMECQNWNAQFPHKHEETPNKYPDAGLGAHNNCRNPTYIDRPWCYTKDPKKRWEYCDVGNKADDCETDNIPVSEVSTKDSKYEMSQFREQVQPAMADQSVGDSLADIVQPVQPDQKSEKCTSAIQGYIKKPNEESYCKKSGSDYMGTVNWTNTGRRCQNWDNPKYHQHSVNSTKYPDGGLGNHNYCRNPDGEKEPWCFTTDPDKKWEYCNVGTVNNTCLPTENKEKEKYCDENGLDYRGNVNKTEKDRTCQRWNMQFPHKHDIKIDRSLGVGNHNYCRNPDKKDRPWCFTNDKKKRWEYCDIGKTDKKCLSKDGNTDSVIKSISSSKYQIAAGVNVNKIGKCYMFRNTKIDGKSQIIYAEMDNLTLDIKKVSIINNKSWPGLQFTDQIDAAFSNEDDHIYFFRGNECIKYNIILKVPEKDYPKKIVAEFPDMEYKNGFDAAFIQRDDNIIFTNESGCISYDMVNKKTLIQNTLKEAFGTKFPTFDAVISFMQKSILIIFFGNHYIEYDLNQMKPLDNPSLNFNRWREFWEFDANEKLMCTKDDNSCPGNDISDITKVYDLINDIRNVGGLTKYLNHKKLTLHDLSKKLGTTPNDIIKAAELKMFTSKKDMFKKDVKFLEQQYKCSCPQCSCSTKINT